jgi:RNA polymerase sigma-70 factor (ECF subfamily)
LHPFSRNIDRIDPLNGLVAGVLRGDKKDIEAFLRVIAPSMLRVIRQLLSVHHPDIPDVLQEASFAVIDSLPRFRGESKVLHFACRIATLCAMNARRRSQLRARYSVDVVDFDALSGSEASPFVRAVAEKRREAFRQLLDELPAPQAEAFTMHCVLGWTVEEAASLIGVPPNTIRSRLIAAKTELKRKVAQDEDLSELLRGAS